MKVFGESKKSFLVGWRVIAKTPDHTDQQSSILECDYVAATGEIRWWTVMKISGSPS
jgi:hypothetical protein